MHDSNIFTQYYKYKNLNIYTLFKIFFFQYTDLAGGNVG